MAVAFKRHIRIAGLFCLVLSCFCSAAETKLPDNKVQWYGFNEGLQKAQTEKKCMVIDFYTSWCVWCKTMDEKTFSEKKVSAFLKEKYICIRINAEDKNEKIEFQDKTFTPVEFTAAFGITGFPSLAFLDKEQKPITIIPGFVPADAFLKILEYMNLEYYKKQIKLDDYIKQETKDNK